MEDDLQRLPSRPTTMDPALWELLASSADGDAQAVEAIIRLDRPHVAVPGVRIVSRFDRIATCRVLTDSILAARQDPNVQSLKAPRLLGPEHEPRNRTTVFGDDRRRPPDLPLTGAGVVVGVVDWGCDFDHPNFIRRDGSTRLRALWDQRGAGSAGSPHPYGYGIVHGRAQIDEALATADPYDTLGYHPADADRGGSGSHGTHVLDIAAGNGFAGGPVGIAPDAELVFVHLADRGTGGLANLGDSVRILEAVDFVARTAGQRPWVVNLSVGRCGGPHDGSTLTELALDSLLRECPGGFICQSAGNYFGASTHARGRLEPGKVESLTFVTDVADLTPNELEVWYSGDDDVVVGISSPTGRPTSAVRLGDRVDVVENDQVVGRIYHRARDPNNQDNHINLFLYPWAPAGRWTVTLEARWIVDGVFHAWLERDEACPPCQVRFDQADADTSCTIGTIANGHLPLVVGAYDAHLPSRTLAPFSSAGPTRDGRFKPDLLAPGEGILAARSAHAGSRQSPGLVVRKSGTSMAAPHVAGTAALCLQAGLLAAEEIRALLLKTAEPVIPHGDRTGCGYLDIARAVAAVSTVRHSRPRSRPYLLPNVSWREPDLEETGMEPDLAHATVVTLGPAKLYRELVYRPGGPLSSWIDAKFIVLARPGEAPLTQPAAGDLLLRVRLGEPGPGHAAVLSDSTLTPHYMLDAGQATAEHEASGMYATVIEDGAFPHCANDRYARRILDSSGRMPAGQLLLRSKRSLEVELNPAEIELDAEAPLAHVPGVVIDAAAAVPPFSSGERSNIQPLLTAKASANAIIWTTANHDARSGVTATDLRGALSSYVDEAAVRGAIQAYNAAHPSDAIGMGGAPIDAVLVECVHQFQMKCYVDTKEHDGQADESTLDSLGLIARTGRAFKGADRANPRAQHRLNNRRTEVSAATRSEFTAANWFENMIDPSFLGQWTKGGNGMHVVLVRKLRQAERHLLTLPDYREMTPVTLGRTLGISEKHGGARPDKTASDSMHTFGLAIDIGYNANPWVHRSASWRALRCAALLVSGVNLRAASAPAFWHGLGSDSARSTEDVWAVLRQRHDELCEYFRLANDEAALEMMLRAHQAAWTGGVVKPGQTIAQAVRSWRNQMRQDLTDLKKGDFKGDRSPTNGFLHLPRDLVVALRDHACLVWGAVDFGPGADGSGDMMHFDARLDGVGAALARGVNPIPTSGHPCLQRPAISSESLTAAASDVSELAEASPVAGPIDISAYPDAPDKSDSFPDGRPENDHRSAITAFRGALSTAMLVGEQAVTLAGHQALASNIDRILGHIDRARSDGLLSEDEAGKLTVAALRELVREPGPGQQPPTAEPEVCELFNWAPQQGETLFAGHGEGDGYAEDIKSPCPIDWTRDQDKVAATTISRIHVHGLVLGNQKPFYYDEGDERKKTNESAKGMAVVLRPAGLVPTEEVDVLLHFHGWSFRIKREKDPYSGDPYAGWRQRADCKVRDVDHDHLEQQMQAAMHALRNPQIICILPQGVGKSNFGNLPAFAYVREVLDKLHCEKKLAGKVTKFRLLLSAHSGGGVRSSR